MDDWYALGGREDIDIHVSIIATWYYSIVSIWPAYVPLLTFTRVSSSGLTDLHLCLQLEGQGRLRRNQPP
jgi:hypothetical protein